MFIKDGKLELFILRTVYIKTDRKNNAFAHKIFIANPAGLNHIKPIYVIYFASLNEKRLQI
jgi:hypothetical protein